MDEGSKLRCTLGQRLTNRYNLYFEPFRWRGDFGLPFNNSHCHRVRAGEQLRAKLRELQTRYPAAAHFVIAHSHGGNVALYALRDLDVQRQVSGLICIGTPFLTVRKRNAVVFRSVLAILLLATLLPAFLWGAPIYVLTMVGIWLAILLGPCLLLSFVLFHFFPGKAAALVWLGACYAWMPFAASGWLASRAEKKIAALLAKPKTWIKNQAQAFIKRWYQKLESTLDAIGVPDASELPIFCVTSEADEAFGSLGLLNVLSELPFKTWNRRLYVAGGILLWVSLLFSGSSKTQATLSVPSISAVGISLGMAALLVCFVAVCHALVLSLVAYMRYPGFGYEAWMSSSLAQIGITRRPEGEHERHETRSYSYSRSAFFNHNALCIDDKPVHDIADWVERNAMHGINSRAVNIHQPET